jgi:negative regulator of sigma E activity
MLTPHRTRTNHTHLMDRMYSAIFQLPGCRRETVRQKWEKWASKLSFYRWEVCRFV